MPQTSEFQIPEVDEMTAEELLQWSRVNLWATNAVLQQFLEERGVAADKFWAYFGKKVAPGYPDGLTAEQMAKITASNLASVGYTVEPISGDENEATLEAREGPFFESRMARMELVPLGSAQEDRDRLANLLRPVVTRQGMSYEWERDGDILRFTFRS